ncbi:hypothetical protein AAHA92_29106 [Salvia divinorum]|uniref:Uncharacterized protein n=1 Tax=Salvia divinorum TaxID=28513 RepID=A0ABD1FX98_SALDI
MLCLTHGITIHSSLSIRDFLFPKRVAASSCRATSDYNNPSCRCPSPAGLLMTFSRCSDAAVRRSLSRVAVTTLSHRRQLQRAAALSVFLGQQSHLRLITVCGRKVESERTDWSCGYYN